MNSKEAFEKLMFEYYLVDEDGKGKHDDLVKQIREDLKVLELLQKHLIFGYNGKAYGFQFYGIKPSIASKLAKWSCRNSYDLLEKNIIKVKVKGK